MARTTNYSSREVKGAKTLVKTASYTVTGEDNGNTIEIGTDALVMTLSAVSTLPDEFEVTFRNIGADGNNIITISPNASDSISGSLSSSEGANADATTADGLLSKASGVDGKDFVNTKATANFGDYVKLKKNGAIGWLITGGIGEWVSET